MLVYDAGTIAPIAHLTSDVSGAHPIFKVLEKKAFETGYAIVDPDIVDKVAEHACSDCRPVHFDKKIKKLTHRHLEAQAHHARASLDCPNSLTQKLAAIAKRTSISYISIGIGVSFGLSLDRHPDKDGVSILLVELTRIAHIRTHGSLQRGKQTRHTDLWDALPAAAWNS